MKRTHADEKACFAFQLVFGFILMFIIGYVMWGLASKELSARN